jgi:hypothetical protein
VIIDDLNIDRARRTIRPFETNAPLIVDANAVLPLSAALQCLKAISGKERKILERAPRFKLIELEFGPPRKSRNGSI